MSDPVSSMDVEDVLSSIRRLVSEEAKGVGSSHESPQSQAEPDIHEAAENAVSEALNDLSRGGDADAHAGVPPSNDFAGTGDEADVAESVAFRHKPVSNRAESDQKLVLTAAFRVPDPAEPEGEAAPAEPPADQVEDSIAAPANPRPERPHLRAISDDDIAPPAEPRTASRPKAFEFAPEESLFDRAKQAMEAIRPETGKPGKSSAMAAETPARDIDAANLTASPAEAADNSSLAKSLRREPKSPEAVEVEEIAEAEEVPSASPFSALGRFQEPAADPVDAAVAEDDEPSTINFAEEEESILDEETLRDLVSEMVREELQGELGDRITRNVRKLVRREIQRAIASREFE